MSLVSFDADVRSLVLYPNPFGPREIEFLRLAIAESVAIFEELKGAVFELKTREEEALSPSSYVKLGVCQYLVGDYDDAIISLSKGDGGALVHFYLAKLRALEKEYDDAIESYDAAKRAGYDPDRCVLGQAEALRDKGELQEALDALDNLHGKIESTAEYNALRASIAIALGNADEGIALYEKAYRLDSRNPDALFGLAVENDRRGNDDEALRLYEAATRFFPPKIGALMNLGLMYEDQERYADAASCFERVLQAEPNNQRAKLYLKDVNSSLINETLEPENTLQKLKREQSLVNFELSQRARKCLESIGARTLDDLLQYTEQELMRTPNFGEISLKEIKELLASEGFNLRNAKDRRNEEQEEKVIDPSLRNRPISSLNLSVRSRKCMTRADVKTIGELVKKTADQLLQCKNFGVSSLKEIREKLAELNLSLSGE